MNGTLSITIMATMLLIASCGKKENTVNSNGYGTSPISVNNPIFSGSGGSAIVTQYNSIRSSVACLPGRTRLGNDVSYFINGGSISGTTVGGNWQPGFMTSGTVSAMYVGVSAFRDLMFLTKVTNGSQVTGYNVTLSYCDVANPYSTTFPLLVSNDRALVNFQAPSGITINTATSCGYGLIAAAYTKMLSQKVLSNPYTFDFLVETTFTKPNCQ
jgi:hypothetical protein